MLLQSTKGSPGTCGWRVFVTRSEFITMAVSFQIEALAADQFAKLFSLDDGELAERGARRCVADAKPGYPCRVSLLDAGVGERLILLPYTHHDTNTPYRDENACQIYFSRERLASRPIIRRRAQNASAEVGGRHLDFIEESPRYWRRPT